MNDTLSIKAVAERRAALIAEAERVLQELAKELQQRIPESMRQWAEEHSFIPCSFEGNTHWKLPEWLDFLVKYAAYSGEYPSGNSEKYRAEDLEVYGFSDFNDLKKKFAELAEAWNGLVRIRFDEDELPWRIEVFFYATELTPDWPSAMSNEEE